MTRQAALVHVRQHSFTCIHPHLRLLPAALCVYAVRTWGSDQPETVQAMAELADLHREMKAESNAEAVERDIIQVRRGAERKGLTFHCGVTGGAAGF